MPRKPATKNYPLPTLDIDNIGSVLRAMPARKYSEPPVKRRYSVTADVLSYRRCKRQYGFFARRGYTSAQSGQLFFGTAIHEALDRAHAHYRGEVPDVDPGTVPNDEDIRNYFAAAERALRSRGIRPLSRESRDKAQDYVLEFNRVEGPTAYPRIVDTEHRLQKDKGTYILHGVVDVIAATKAEAQTGGHWEDYEIWDYKGSKRPEPADMLNYEFQMRVYAHLYETRNGRAPKRAILWFLGERGDDRRVEVQLTPEFVADAVTVFEETVGKIEASINCGDWSNLKDVSPPSAETCDACDLRWNCPSPAKSYRLRGLRSA